MIRYNKTIELNTNKNGEQRLFTDLGQTWNITTVKESNQFTVWLQANHTNLREWQRDMLQIIHQAYNQETGLHPMQMHWVYKKGQGYLSQSDCAFAIIPSKNLYILMTPQNTWIQESKFQNLKFSVSDASGCVTSKETQDEIWNFRDMIVHGKIFDNKNYTDDDYARKGLV